MTLQGDDAPTVEPSKRSRARRKVVAVAVPTGVALGAGTVFAYGAIPGSDGSVGVSTSRSRRCVSSTAPRTAARAPPVLPAESFLKINQRARPAPPDRPARRPAGAAGPSGLGVPVHPIPASDYLLEIDGIKGESKDAKHKDTIEIFVLQLGRDELLALEDAHVGRRRRRGQGADAGHPLRQGGRQVLAGAVQALRRPGSTSRRRSFSSARPAAASRST